MTDEQINQIYTVIRSQVRKLNLPMDQSEDLAHEVYLKIIDRKIEHQDYNIRHLLIDVLRQKILDVRAKKLNRPCKINTKLVSFDDFMRTLAGPAHEFSDFDNLISRCQGIERCLIVLRYVWDFNFDEIGHCFGVTGSQAFNWIKHIVGELKSSSGC